MQENAGDDKTKTLQELAAANGKPIIDLLLGIQKHQERQGKDLSFVRGLECFYARPNRKRKQAPGKGVNDGHKPAPHTSLFRSGPLNAYEERNYVAVSWCWQPFGHRTTGSLSENYELETRNGRMFPPRLRDRVLDRVLKYMRHFNIALFWIDRYSIPQRPQHGCKRWRECDHNRCIRKREGLQAMDLVYKHSDYPIGLLERQLSDEQELNLLARLLDGVMVGQASRAQHFWLTKGTDPEAAKATLLLVHRITSDPWWERAWIFQENYRGGTGMTLLLGHSHNLEKLKRALGQFHDVLGELCISSVEFSYEATRLCQALRTTKDTSTEEQGIIDAVLSAAGRYTLLLHGSKSMSPSIIADIEKRGSEDPWDRIAITANCCKYPIQLDDWSLKAEQSSLALSMLTMFLLNGEILNNCGVEASKGSQNCTVSDFLKLHCFNDFQGPGNKQSLTFNKGCRFTDVVLRNDGILTKGHLWELGPIINLASLSDNLPWINKPDGLLSLHQRRRLLQLSNKLEALSYDHLAKQLQLFLDQDAACIADDEFVESTFSEDYMRQMAAEIVASIDDNKLLRLGCLSGIHKQHGIYSAIFAWNEDHDGSTSTAKHPVTTKPVRDQIEHAHVFTASWPRDTGWAEHDPNDIDRHVSLEVLVPGGLERQNNLPRLYTHHWRPGLCFFKGCPRKEVIFPWPPALQDVKPTQV